MDANEVPNPNNQGQERRQGANGVPPAGSFEEFVWWLRVGFVFMTPDRAIFARQATVLAHPQNAEVVKSVTHFSASPTASDEVSAAHVAEFLSNAESLEDLRLFSTCPDGQRPETEAMTQSVLDLWLSAVTQNDAVQLDIFRHGAYAASLPVFQQFVLRKLHPKGVPLSLQASPGHLRNLTGYLDASVGLRMLCLDFDREDGVESTMNLMKEVLPLALALTELHVTFPRESNARVDIAALFASRSVHSLSVSHHGTCTLSRIPSNDTLRTLRLHSMTLESSALATFASLVALEDLSLSRATLSCVPVISTLRKLELNSTNLTINAVEALLSLGALEDLSFSGGTLFDGEELGVWTPNPSLRKLRLSSTVLGANALRWIRSLAVLAELVMIKCKAPFGEGLTMRMVLANLNSLERLLLSSIASGHEGSEWWQGLIPYLYGSSTLKSLSIHEMRLPASVLAELRHYLASDVCSLACLRLPDRVLKMDLDDRHALLQALAKSNSVEHFHLGRVSKREEAMFGAFVADAMESDGLKDLPTLTWDHDWITTRQLAHPPFVELVTHVKQLNNLNWYRRAVRRSEKMIDALWPAGLTQNDKYGLDHCPHCSSQWKKDVDYTSLVYKCLRARPEVVRTDTLQRTWE